MLMGGDVACMGEIRRAYKIAIRKPEGKRTFGRPSVQGWMILIWILNK
jgi:hypothetical protein